MLPAVPQAKRSGPKLIVEWMTGGLCHAWWNTLLLAPKFSFGVTIWSPMGPQIMLQFNEVSDPPPRRD